MNSRTLLAAALGLVVGLVGGFFVANGINKAELTELRGKAAIGDTAKTNPAPPRDELTIGDDEIKAKIAQADADPGNFDFQKNLGGALYRYASMKNDRQLAAEARRILERAYELDPKSYEVTVDLGNAYFDEAYAARNRATFQKAQDMYQKALAARPGDADVRTDLGISFILVDPPNEKRAVDEFQKVLSSNPGHERAQQFLTQAYVQMGNWAEAGKSLGRLRTLNPKNPKIEDLSSQIAAKKAEPVK